MPEDKTTFIYGIKDSNKFQMRTDKKIDSENYIRWSMGQVGWFQITEGEMSAEGCAVKLLNPSSSYGFFERAGDLTFLKTVTQLKVWFDDTLVVTWVYEDLDNTTPCTMRKLLAGMKFKSTVEDKVSIKYRYEIGTNTRIHDEFKHT